MAPIASQRSTVDSPLHASGKRAVAAPASAARSAAEVISLGENHDCALPIEVAFACRGCGTRRRRFPFTTINESVAGDFRIRFDAFEAPRAEAAWSGEIGQETAQGRRGNGGTFAPAWPLVAFARFETALIGLGAERTVPEGRTSRRRDIGRESLSAHGTNGKALTGRLRKSRRSSWLRWSRLVFPPRCTVAAPPQPPPDGLGWHCRSSSG